MVRGDWIFYLDGMRCKNWVNGIEVVFSFDPGGILKGTIHHIPPALMLQSPGALEIAVLAYRMRQQATALFKRIYQKRAVPRNGPVF
jgi:hypothetical protein